MVVALSFDSDHETPALRDGVTGPGAMAAGEYGARVGVPRILRLLERFGVPASFYMPAVSALLHADEARRYVAEGHELALHGWIHERNTMLGADDERELQLRAADTLEQITGVRPVGLRTPSWDFSEHTLGIIQEMGLLYDSSLMADDEPYELLADGEPTGVAEIPVEWIRDDAAYLVMERFAGLRPYTPPASILKIWQDEFREALAAGGVFQLTMHPHIIGHRSRIVILRELLEEVTTTTDVWFATHAQLAEYCLTHATTQEPGSAQGGRL